MSDRKQAIALGAADAKALLSKYLPYVASVLSTADLAQVQKVLDAEVVNPEIARKANEVYSKSVISQSGGLILRNQRTVDRAYHIMATQIAVKGSDKHIRLDYHKLLKPAALKAATDNPDEADYLRKVQATLQLKGVWLRFEHQLVHDPEDPSCWVVDPKSFIAWLSVGYDGDAIPTKDGQIDREELLGTVLFGAGYYDAVHRGPTQRSLDRQIELLNEEIISAIEEHNRLARRKLHSPIVSGISDFAGRANLPDQSIWDFPRQMLSKARELNVGGNVFRSPPFLVIAAIVVRKNASLLAEYEDDSTAGAGRVVKVLKVARTAGKVAEVGLALTGVVAIARNTITITVGDAVVGDAAIDSAAERMIAQHYGKDAEILSNMSKARSISVPQPTKGSIINNLKTARSAGRGTGFHEGW